MGDYNITFYTYGSTLELNGVQLDAGRLSEDLLNLSPENYRPMHEHMERVTELEQSYAKGKQLSVWWELNEEMALLCQELRHYVVFRLLLDEDEDRFFSVFRQITESISLFPDEKKNTVERIKNFLDSYLKKQEESEDPAPQFSGLFDTEDAGETMYYDMLVSVGATDDTWKLYQQTIDRYRLYLHDIRAFVPTIRNFIKFSLSKLKENTPENYAAALHGFYYDRRIAEKLIVNPIRYHGDCYKTHDQHLLSYVPRELPDGSVAICQEHVTDSLQALMKADYMLALNSGHNIRRCIICQRYFLVRSGVHALYCEGACPHDKRFTCRQFGSVDVQKELAKDVPKIRAKQKAFDRIQQDKRRGIITGEECRRAKDYVRDMLYDALRRSNLSVDAFTESISSEQVYKFCRIDRTSNPRGRPPKPKVGGAP